MTRAGIAAGAGMLLVAPSMAMGQTPARTPIAATPHFAFHSDFNTNLNDALIAAGIARKAGRAELFRSGPEASCFDRLPPPVRAAWDRSVDYYAEIISPTEWTAPEQFRLRVHLAGFDGELGDADSRQFVDIVQGFGTAASPAYATCRWTSQDEKNRRWINALRSQLDAHEQLIAARLEQLYEKRWTGLPIIVDVVETVNWSGANSIYLDAGGGHLLVSPSYEGPAALEIVFHEASHLLMGRTDPVRMALEKAALDAGFRLPGDLWHLVLFHTTGETVRQSLEARGVTGYTPFVNSMFDSGTWVGYRNALERAWRPYVAGERTLADAAAGLIEALRAPPP
jgi:hypothetical protein